MSRGDQLDVREETRRLIMQAFLEAYAEKPFEKIAVAEIVERASCSRNTFYRYFCGMEDLLAQVEEENTCTDPCRRIVENAADIPLGTATDDMATFYQQRVRAVKVLVRGSRGEAYLTRQCETMKPMFRALITRALDLTPMQEEYVSEYVARSKTEMIRLWIEKDCRITLEQINKMSETLVERNLWNEVAFQHPDFGGPKPRQKAEPHRFDYPWEHRN